MNDRLKEYVREARRELRRASGVPMTADEQAEERRLAEVEEMEMFLARTFSLNLRVDLIMRAVPVGTSVLGEITLDDHTFHLRRDGDSYRLYATGETDHAELVCIESSDPNFAYRVLVAIDDSLEKP